jgi:hypothetical protein
MLEFLLELFLQLSLEAAFEFAADLLGALIFRLFAALAELPGIANPIFAFFACLFFGAATGLLSLWFFPHSFGSSLSSSGPQPGLQASAFPFPKRSAKLLCSLTFSEIPDARCHAVPRHGGAGPLRLPAY